MHIFFIEICQSVRNVNDLYTIYNIYESKTNYTKVQNDIINICIKKLINQIENSNFYKLFAIYRE